VNISNLDIGQLKILAYDTGRKLGAYQQDLQVINDLISQKERLEQDAKANIARSKESSAGSEANKPGDGHDIPKNDKK
jgi:hypothetical protein